VFGSRSDIFFGSRPVIGRDPEKNTGRDLDRVEVPNTTIFPRKFKHLKLANFGQMAKIGQLKVKGEDKNKGFQKRIPFYFMNAWFESLAKLKLANFGQMAKIGQLEF
jgi:hypothetical protein